MLESYTSFCRNEILGGVLERLAEGSQEEDEMPIYLTPPYRPRRVVPLSSRQSQHGISPFHNAKRSPLNHHERRQAVWQAKGILTSPPKHEPWWDEFIDELGLKEEAPIRHDKSPSPSPPPLPPSPTPLARSTKRRNPSDRDGNPRLVRFKPAAGTSQNSYLHDQEGSVITLVTSSLLDRDLHANVPMSSSPVTTTRSTDTLGAKLTSKITVNSKTSAVTDQHGLDMLVLAALGSDIGPASSDTPPADKCPTAKPDLPECSTSPPALVTAEPVNKPEHLLDDNPQGSASTTMELTPIKDADLGVVTSIVKISPKVGCMSDSRVTPKSTPGAQEVGYSGILAAEETANATETPRADHVEGVTPAIQDVAPQHQARITSSNDMDQRGIKSVSKAGKQDGSTSKRVISSSANLQARSSQSSEQHLVENGVQILEIAGNVTVDTAEIDEDSKSAFLSTVALPTSPIPEITITLEIKRELAERGRVPTSPLTPSATPEPTLNPVRRGNNELKQILQLNERQAPISWGEAGHDLTSRRSRKRPNDVCESELLKAEDPLRNACASQAPNISRGGGRSRAWTEQDESLLVYFALDQISDERYKVILDQFNLHSSIPRSEGAIRQKLAIHRSKYATKSSQQ